MVLGLSKLFGRPVRAPSLGKGRAIVSLCGPLPGIVIGTACAVLFRLTGSPFLMQSARAFLIINTFNLLPITPLDGGRCMEAVLFSRTPMLKAAFDVLAALALAVLAFTLGSIVLGLLAFVMLGSIKLAYASGQLARDIKRELADHRDIDPALTPVLAESRRIPSSYIERLIPLLEDHLSEHQRSPEAFARAFRNVWNMVRFQPPSVGATGRLAAGLRSGRQRWHYRHGRLELSFRM